MARAERILIVGGGIGGLSLAAALHRRGFTPALIERSPAWRVVGAGIAVQPNGIRLLRTLGIGPPVEHAGAVIRHWDFCDDRGDVLCETDLQSLWGDVGPFIGIARAELQRALIVGASRVPSRLGVSITSITHGDDEVSVELSDGSTAVYDLVVGADGVASTVRRLAVDDATPVYGGQMAFRSLAPIRPRRLTKLQFLLGDGCFFGLCPVGGGHTYGFGNVTGPRMHDAVEGRLARLRERFDHFGRIVHDYLAALESDEQVHASPIEWVAQDAWYRGRVVLIGDAAHATSPMMGQGGSLAIEDACVLADALHSAASVERALADYVVRRSPRVQWVRQQSQVTGASLRLPVPVRNSALRAHGDDMMRQRFRPLAEAAM